jgi:pyruvate/2-oxoglutarate dehydrogenase complex dihydrolipoamide acyltransferase (E2) component
VVQWAAKEGDRVEQGQVLVTIETQKIKFDVVAEASGFLHIVVAEETACPVGTVVGLIAASLEELVELQRARPFTSSVQSATDATSAAKVEAAQPTVKVERKEIRISPVARKMAEEHMIDITLITGTGPEGRIVREDIEKAIAAKGSVPVKTSPEKTPEAEVIEGKRVKYVVPLKGMRGVIAEHMHRSLAQSAQLTAIGEIDMGELIKLRKALAGREQILGTRVTYTDIFVFVAAKVLREKPIVNSSIIGKEIKVWDDINIGVAVALEEGLIVPVVRNADRKSLSEISMLTKTLGDKARTGKLSPDEVSSGTFTITNLGAAGAGWRFETAILNPPEAAILGTGGITDRAAVRDGQVVVRPIMTYSFTYDHRVMDGTVAVEFMARVIELLENPAPLIL